MSDDVLKVAADHLRATGREGLARLLEGSVRLELSQFDTWGEGREPHTLRHGWELTVTVDGVRMMGSFVLDVPDRFELIEALEAAFPERVVEPRRTAPARIARRCDEGGAGTQHPPHAMVWLEARPPHGAWSCTACGASYVPGDPSFAAFEATMRQNGR